MKPNILNTLLICTLLLLHFGLQAQPTVGLVAHYKFSGNANDISGNGNNAIVHGATLTSDEFGQPNSAYFFNGSSYIEMPVAPMLLGNYSYAICLKPTSLPGTNNLKCFLSIGDVTADQYVTIANITSGSQIGMSCGSYYAPNVIPPDRFSSGVMPLVNQYYHVIVTRSNTQLKMFVNGVLINTVTVHTPVPSYGNGTTQANIGCRVTNVQFFQGVIDDVAIYNRALDDAEITGFCSCVQPTVNLGPDTMLCNGSLITLNAGNPGASFTWFRNGLIIPGANTQSIIANQDGNYSVSVNNASCISNDTISVSYFNTPSPAISANGPTVFCNGDSVTLTCTSPGLTYLWSNNQTSQSITTGIQGSYSVQITDSHGCHASSPATNVTVNPKPVPAILSSGSTSLCPGDSITLSPIGDLQNISSYLWSSNETSPSIVVNSGGTFYLAVTDQNGCSGNSNSISVVLHSLPNLVVSNDTTICEGTSTVLTATGAQNYVWSPSAGLNHDTGSSVIASPGTSTNYLITGTDINNCTNTANVRVDIDALPQVTISSSQTIGCVPNAIYLGLGPQTITLTANAVNATSYLWSSGQTTSSITISTAGIYNVTVWNSSGCSAVSNEAVTSKIIDARCGSRLQNITICHVPQGNSQNPQTLCLSPNSVSTHLLNHPGDCIGACVLRLKKPVHLSDSYSIFPNPTSASFTFHSEIDLNGASVFIYDQLGRLVEMLTELSSDFQFGQNLSPGIYSVKLINEGDETILKAVKIN